MRENIFDVEFKGYWSEKEKQVWEETNWKERDYKELSIEEDAIQGIGHFYGMGDPVEKQMTFVKYIRANPIYPPYYGPVITSELYDFIKENHFVGPMFDGEVEGNYDIHNRYETNDLYLKLSN